MQDFIDEACELFEDGLHINNVDYSVEIVGFSFDTPARAFIKCVKGHQSFYACERCVTKRKTVNKKRVYPSRNAAFRTKLSFRRQSQSQHHVGLSPLTHLPNFDRSVNMPKTASDNNRASYNYFSSCDSQHA